MDRKDRNQNIAEIESRLLTLTRAFLAESGNYRLLAAVSLDANLEQELGIGSLEKTELFHRIERIFHVQFTEAVLIQARSLRDILLAIQQANPSLKFLAPEHIAHSDRANVNLSAAKTLSEVLQLYAVQAAEHPHIYLQDEQGKEKIISYGDLYAAASNVAQGLIAYQLEPGETVAIMLPTGAEFFYVFFGILLAGGIPVPIYPPFRPDQIEEYALREAGILQNAEARILITFDRAKILSKLLQTFIFSLKEVVTFDMLLNKEKVKSELVLRKSEAKDAALIQYTSGSTGNPKGVFLTHANMLANIRAIGEVVTVQPHDVIVSWLPLYHDMGLNSWLCGLYFGVPIVIMSPLAFLTRPERWLWAIHYHRATISGGPNFAYEMCLRKIEPALLEGLDLSCWRIAFNGAEAVYAKTLIDFEKKFSAYGFKKTALFPVYGLAEATVALTFPPVGRGPLIDKIKRASFEIDRRAIPITATATEKNYYEFVSCGKPLPKHEVRIVNEQGEEVGERMVGRLQFKGPSAMQGYYHNPAATQAVFADGWWESGDFAYRVNDEIFITGRKKDVIIKAGRNLYPQEIEEIASQAYGVRKGCVVAFGVADPKQGTEQFIIVAETYTKEMQEKNLIIGGIIEKIVAAIGIPPDQVVLVPPKTVPKTSSGKLKRSAARQAYIEGKLLQGRPPAWLQMSRLFLQSGWKKIHRGFGLVARLFYTAYLMVMTAVTFLPVWLGLFILSSSSAAWLAHKWAKLIFVLIGCPIKIIGKENLPKSQQVIFVANHASYVDSVVLLAALPKNAAFIGKIELLNTPIIRTLIKKLGYLTVDRLDFAKGMADTKKIIATLQQGKDIIIFPEGTFTYATGLRPFKAGAFQVAVETGTAICPVGICGTRQMLRSGSWLFKPTKLKVIFGALISPQEKEWDEVLRLRKTARAEIAKACQEEMIDLVTAGPEKLGS